MSKQFEQSGGCFLDLSSCGSSIRYGVQMSVRRWRKGGHRNIPGIDPPAVKKKGPWKYATDFDFDISMTDCAKGIRWSAETPKLAKKKLRKAIAMFEKAIREVEQAAIFGKREMRRMKREEKKDG